MLLVAIVMSFILAAISSALIRVKRVMGLVSLVVSATAVAGTGVLAYRVATTGTYHHPAMLVSVDALGAVVLLVVSIVGFCATMYSIPYFGREATNNIIGLRRVQQYYVLANIFMAAVFMAASVSNPVAAWIFLEVTTLSTVFLISYYNRASTIEAAWKYLIINAVGLQLAFLGTLLYMSASGGSTGGFMTWQTLQTSIAYIDPDLIKIAFVFVLIGYGTKIGLAPMHTWKPDAYSKSPAPLGALFSGALMPVAFLILLRFKGVTDAAVGAAYSRHLLIVFGLLSILVAAFSIMSVKNYKRMLAYSSVEHAGIIALGFAFGGLGSYAALLHMVYHSFIKSSLFFTTGNLMIKYHSARIQKISGIMTVLPVTSVLLLVGMFAATGLPPFGIFLTELSVLSAGLSGHVAVVGVVVAAVAIVFIGFFRHVSGMAFSNKPEGITPGGDTAWLLAAPIVLLVLILVIGFYVPPFMQTLLHQAVEGL
jgi:hydrogenase-4 component F